MMAVETRPTAEDVFGMVVEATKMRGIAKQAFLEAARAALNKLAAKEQKQLIKRIANMNTSELAIMIGIGLKEPMRGVVLKKYLEIVGRKL